jgi:hypothetical protein
MKWVRASCKAFEKPYTPSMFELEEYCRRKDHRKCPFYLRNTISAARSVESNLLV